MTPGNSEPIVVPSFGILLILCLGTAGYSWFVILNHLPHAAVFGFGIADLITVPIFAKFSLAYLRRSSMSHTTDVGKGSGLDAIDKDLQRHVGVTVAVDATLRPTGRIRIGDDTFEAQTGGEFVEKGAYVRIVSVNGGRFQVEKALNP